MNVAKAELHGGTLNSFVLAFGASNPIVTKILSDAGFERIDPDAWYDYDVANAIFYRISEQVGRAAVMEVGRKMLETAFFPPEMDSVPKFLMSLGAAFKLNTRGDIGDILCTLEDDHSATIVRTQRGVCPFNMGIIEGGCARLGVKPLIEHGTGGCQDNGAATCTYHVTW